MVAAALALVAGASRSSVAGPGPQALVDAWRDAVARHELGTADAQALAVSHWTPAQLDQLYRGLLPDRRNPAPRLLWPVLEAGAALHADIALRIPVVWKPVGPGRVSTNRLV